MRAQVPRRHWCPRSSNFIPKKDVVSIPPPPSHIDLDQWPFWRPVSTLCSLVFKALCIPYAGEPGLDTVWTTAGENRREWTRRKDRYGNALNCINLVGSLLLAAVSTFLTSTPPNSPLVDYNQRWPYICLIMCLGITMGGLIVGSALLYGIAFSSGIWFQNTFLHSRSRVCCTLLLFSYPFISIGVASSFFAFGLLMACWQSQDQVLRVCSTCMVATPGSMLFLFLWTQVPIVPLGKNRRQGARAPSDLESSGGVSIVASAIMSSQ